MTLSTAKILDRLLRLPYSGKIKPVESEEHAGQTDQNKDTIVSQEGNTEDALQLKIKTPRITPHRKNALTLAEQLLLKEELVIAKRTLENFKDILRQHGCEVTHYFVAIQNGRITYHIPNQKHYNQFMQNKDKYLRHVNGLEIEKSKSIRRTR